MQILLLGVALFVPAWAGQDAALKDRVAELVTRLTTGTAEARDEAERVLVGLGERVLPLLPGELPRGADDDAQARWVRVRTSIEEASERALGEPSRVTLQGEGVRLSEVLRQLQQQSGNRITDMREAYGAEATNPALHLDISNRPFFEALDEVAEQAGVSVTYFTGDGSIGLMPGASQLESEYTGAVVPRGQRVRYAGPYRVELKRIGLVRDLTTGTARASAQFELAWEPRLRPMLLALRSEQLEIVDDLGQKVQPDVDMESTSTVLRPENPVAEVNLNMRAPDRKAQSLKSLTVKSDVTLPAGLRRFRFDNLNAENVVRTQGDVKLTLESTEVDDNVWKVGVRLEMPGEGAAFESYRQGLFNNQIWLQKADGSRFEHNGGFSTTASGPGMLGFEYLFVDVPGRPGDYALYYETPSRVVQVPLEFTFENVILP